MFDLFISLHSYFFISLCLCVLACFILEFLYPHILRCMCPGSHPCVLISPGLCELACKLVSSHHFILKLMCSHSFLVKHSFLLSSSKKQESPNKREGLTDNLNINKRWGQNKKGERGLKIFFSQIW